MACFLGFEEKWAARFSTIDAVDVRSRACFPGAPRAGVEWLLDMV